MKFVLFLMKSISLILCLGLLGTYFYFAFGAQEPNQTMSNLLLFLFVLSMLVSAWIVLLVENHMRQARPSGLDAYISSVRKEENIAKQVQAALPADLLPLMEKLVASLDKNQENVNSSLAQSQKMLSTLLADNQNSVNERLRQNDEAFKAVAENLLSQISASAAKNLPPLNLALENINARLDDLENKIIGNRTGLGQDVVTEPEKINTDKVENNPEPEVSKTVEVETAEDENLENNGAEQLQNYAETIADKDNYTQFNNELSDLAGLEIMQEPVAPTVPEFEDVDIDTFLKDRTDVKK